MESNFSTFFIIIYIVKYNGFNTVFFLKKISIYCFKLIYHFNIINNLYEIQLKEIIQLINCNSEIRNYQFIKIH